MKSILLVFLDAAGDGDRIFVVALFGLCVAEQLGEVGQYLGIRLVEHLGGLPI